jgi:hypothetical protein
MQIAKRRGMKRAIVALPGAVSRSGSQHSTGGKERRDRRLEGIPLERAPHCFGFEWHSRQFWISVLSLKPRVGLSRPEMRLLDRAMLKVPSLN